MNAATLASKVCSTTKRIDTTRNIQATLVTSRSGYVYNEAWPILQGINQIAL